MSRRIGMYNIYGNFNFQKCTDGFEKVNKGCRYNFFENTLKNKANILNLECCL